MDQNAWFYDGFGWEEEDFDDDNDFVLDVDDDCHFGELNWTSTPETDFDGDGCRDATEDIDDDNDGVNDTADYCINGVEIWIFDYDYRKNNIHL